MENLGENERRRNSNHNRRRRPNTKVKKQTSESVFSKVITFLKKNIKIILVVISVAVIVLGLVAFFGKNSNTPESKLRNFISSYKKDTKSAINKFSESKLDKFIRNENARFLEYKVLDKKKTSDTPETYEVKVEIKNTNTYDLMSKANFALDRKGVKKEDRNYISKFKKAYIKENKKKKEEMQYITTEKTLIIVKDEITGEFIIANSYVIN